MSIRVTTMPFLAAFCLLCGSASADWLVLRGGKKIETAGTWTLREGLLVVHEPAGRALALTLSVIDYDATLKSNPRSGSSTARSAGDPSAHVDTASIKRLQDLARRQAEEGARLRAQAGSDAMAAAAGTAPGNRLSGKDQDQGGSQARGAQKAAAKARNFDALKNCAVWENNPSQYNTCLTQNGH